VLALSVDELLLRGLQSRGDVVSDRDGDLYRITACPGAVDDSRIDPTPAEKQRGRFASAWSMKPVTPSHVTVIKNRSVR
jgi:hypothetical protein